MFIFQQEARRFSAGKIRKNLDFALEGGILIRVREMFRNCMYEWPILNSAHDKLKPQSI